MLSRSATAAGMSGSMGIKTAALDPFRGYANAIRDELPARCLLAAGDHRPYRIQQTNHA